MADVSEETTRKIASLARLRLTDDEVKRYTLQIAQVIEHVEQIAEVDVEGIEPLVYGVDLNLPERADEAKPFPLTADGRPKIIEHAPRTLENGFQVPPIL